MTSTHSTGRIAPVLLAALIAAGCSTQSFRPEAAAKPAMALDGAARTLADYRAAATASDRDPDNMELLGRTVALARQYVGEYLAEESKIPPNDLWRRRDCLAAFERTGMLFDQQVDFELRDREARIKTVEDALAQAEAMAQPEARLDTLKPILPYAPYSERIRSLLGSAAQEDLAGAEKLGLAQRFERLRKLQGDEPLPPAIQAERRQIVDEAVAALRTLPLSTRLEQFAEIRPWVPYFPELVALQTDALGAAKAEAIRLFEAGSRFDAVRLSVIGKELWPHELLFTTLIQAAFTNAAARCLGKVDALQAACGDDRLATEFIYTLAGWRFAPGDEQARTRSVGMAPRMRERYGVTATVAATGGDPEVVHGFLKNLNPAPVVISGAGSRGKSRPGVLLTITFSEATVRTGSRETRENSRFESGINSITNPAYAAVKARFDALAADYQNILKHHQLRDFFLAEKNEARQKMDLAQAELNKTPEVITTPKYEEYQYTKTTYTISPTLVLTYTLVDEADGKTYEGGQFSRTRNVSREAIRNTRATDAGGVVDRGVDLNAEIPTILGAFLQEIGAEFSRELRDKSELVLLRAVERAGIRRDAGEALDRLLAYKFLDTAATFGQYSMSGEAMFRVLGFEPIPARLEAMFRAAPTAVVNADQKEFDWAAVVRETAGYGRPLPAENKELSDVLGLWDPDDIACPSVSVP